MALEYIEGRLDGEFNVGEAACVACSSLFHFQRMFHVLTGVTVADYVRRRRLTLAAQELASSRVKVIDVALKYGYDTPESFSKAFRKMQGISPSAARVPGARLKAYPRLSFQISLKGDKDMEYRIVEKKAFAVVGKSIRVTTKDGENFKRIPQFWDECYQNGFNERLFAVAGDMGVLGMCMEFNQEQEEFTYMIAIEKPKGHVPENLEEKQIPSATWAVFESIGPMPDAIQKVWGRIFSEWFSATGYEHADAPEIEVYPSGNTGDADYRCEIRIPVIRKGP
jgi:AraC family transcriptional regulator